VTHNRRPVANETDSLGLDETAAVLDVTGGLDAIGSLDASGALDASGSLDAIGSLDASGALDATVLGGGLDETAGALDATAAVVPGARRVAREPRGLARGSSVGRYVVLGELGAGGMGVVYAAYDPELDRKVAVKLLRPELGARTGTQAAEQARMRLLREAQALAKLGHPNVVAIHDVGTVADGVWLAMEFVEGETLGAWAAARRRSWREVLDVMRAAGRGLMAAHAAGLVHRDFKPDNVMVANDGRVRVMDLGLARRGAEPEVRAPAAAAYSDDSLPLRLGQSALKLELTHVGAVMGTPAYMAPEQHNGGEVGPAADIFAFCVTFWEGLYGERPFAGESYQELALNVTSGAARPPPRGRSAPRWLRRIVERGLAVDPALRWPSSERLIDALGRGQARARATFLGVTAALVVAAGSGGWAWQAGQQAAAVASCEAAGAGIDAVWNDEARARVREGLQATGLSYAATTVEKVTPWLDRQAEAWRAARTEACVDAEIRGTLDAGTRERGDQCLDERRLALASLVESLAQAGPEAAMRAVSAAATLEPVAACRDPGLLARSPTQPVEVAAQVQAAREAVITIDESSSAGRSDAGVAAARAALAAAEASAWPPIVAEAQRKLGALLAARDELAGAEEALERAYFTASEAGALGVAADAGLLLANIATKRGRHDEGKRWLRHADLAIRPLEPAAGLRTARRFSQLTVLLTATAEYAQAGEAGARALAIQESILGAGHPELVGTLNLLADVQRALGDEPGTRALLERALAIAEDTLGADHPALAISLLNLSQLQQRLHPLEALALQERALAIQERAFGRGSGEVAAILLSVANVHRQLGDHERSRVANERALAIFEATLGPEHPRVAAALATLASNRKALGAHAEAKALNLRALKIFERSLGPEHPDVAKTLKNLANSHKTLDEFAEAKPLLERALAIREKVLGPKHPVVALTLIDVGSVNMDLGDPVAAKEPYTRALAIAELQEPRDEGLVASALVGLVAIAASQRDLAAVAMYSERTLALLGGLPPGEHGYVGAKLAMALWRADPKKYRAQARDLAVGARDALRGGKGDASSLAEIEAWLAAHPAR